jgi:hypothetical protein
MIGVRRAAVRLEVWRHTHRTGTRDIQGHRALGWTQAFFQACIAFQLGLYETIRGAADSFEAIEV